jgi:hypothetical protein
VQGGFRPQAGLAVSEGSTSCPTSDTTRHALRSIVLIFITGIVAATLCHLAECNMADLESKMSWLTNIMFLSLSSQASPRTTTHPVLAARGVSFVMTLPSELCCRTSPLQSHLDPQLLSRVDPRSWASVNLHCLQQTLCPLAHDACTRYPDREDMGLLKGVVGGWAGGETALWQFREEIKVGEPGSRGSSSWGYGQLRRQHYFIHTGCMQSDEIGVWSGGEHHSIAPQHTRSPAGACSTFARVGTLTTYMCDACH